MRALINQVSGGGVVLQYDDALSGVRVERAFVCDDRPHAYVRELLPGGGTRQPCDALDTRGATLTCNGRADLLAVIRHEYRAMRRQERRLARHQERRW